MAVVITVVNKAVESLAKNNNEKIVAVKDADVPKFNSLFLQGFGKIMSVL
jgi:hypothetical protein